MRIKNENDKKSFKKKDLKMRIKNENDKKKI